MLQSSTPLRKHINNFLKHVHPDLFHEDIEFERVNLDSLQKLHCFIDEVKQFENGASHGAVRLLGPRLPLTRSALRFRVTSSSSSS